MFFSLNGNLLYISDKERFSHFYVYDRLFPCRDEDYSIASFRNVCGGNIAYEVLDRTIYISSCIKWGLYNSDSGSKNIFAAGMGLIFTSENVKFEMSWLNDIKYNIREGFLTFSATAVYL